MKKIDFMLTAFRDGLQSAYGSRVLSGDYLPVVEACAKAGITHFESGGGALFQSAYFYCNEDAFDVMDAFRAATGPAARLQTLARGVNLVGLEGQSSDVIKLHAALFKKHGVDVIRNFDAMNDVENLKYSGACIREAGLKHELAISMMELPPESPAEHGADFYIALLRRFLDAGIEFDSLCFKDASGTCTPTTVHDAVKGARKILGPKARIVFHGHDTAGLGVESCMGAIEAGVDQVDLSLAPCSGGTCQADLLSLWHALRGTEYSLDIDPHKVIELEELFKDALKDYFLPPEATRVDPLISFFPMPGGALTSNTQMLRDNGLLYRYRDVIKAMGEAMVKGGLGTSVTPVSQFYFQQAFNNVMYGPWTRIAEGYGKMVLGYFGKTPEEPDPEVKRLAVAQLNLPPASMSPLDYNNRDPQKGLGAARAVLEAAGLPASDESLFIAAECQEKGILFLKGGARRYIRKGGSESPAASAPADAGLSDSLTVTINNRAYGVNFSGSIVSVNGLSYNFAVKPGIDAEAVAKTAVLPKDSGVPAIATSMAIDSPLSGILTRLYKKAGDKVAVGETVMVIDAMGVEVPVNSRYSGIVQDIFVHLGEQVEAAAPLFRLSIIEHGTEKTVSHAAEARLVEGKAKGEAALASPISGLVLRIYKESGEKVRAGESVLVLESMKMETPINCPIEGRIEAIAVRRGDIVREGEILASVAKEGGQR